MLTKRVCDPAFEKSTVALRDSNPAAVAERPSRRALLNTPMRDASSTDSPIVRINSKRFEQSPFAEKYADENILFGIYARRFYPISLGEDVIADYWKLRREVMLYDVPEKPLDIKGPDAVALLERVFTRPISTLKTWRARYAIACTPQGGIIMDGVLIRLAEDHFWYVEANGDFESWLLAFAEGLDVAVSDPQSRVLQIQGPRSLALLQDATNGQVPDNFGYFHAGMFSIGGQEVLVSRTGWTGEVGFEVYGNPDIDHSALWDHLVVSGKDHGMAFGSGASMGIRRIEAGILDYDTDIDRSMTPFDAGLGNFVDFSNEAFVGRDALLDADKNPRLYGLSTATGIPAIGAIVFDGEKKVAVMKVGDWSPTLEKGIGYVLFDQPTNDKGIWLGQSLTLRDLEGKDHDCQIVSMPFFDAEKKIPRGLVVTDD